jgi:catechol 2,3-dioxygenase-like lactoylglutathione lyase family enzyme
MSDEDQDLPTMKLELVPIPVSDLERSKEFYQKLGFGNMHDTKVSENMRVIQFTPPGSACSIVFGSGMSAINEMEPGTIKGLHLVVEDMDKARNYLIGRDVDMGDVQDMGGVKYSWFSDPDGNIWTLQQWPAGYQAF